MRGNSPGAIAQGVCFEIRSSKPSSRRCCIRLHSAGGGGWSAERESGHSRRHHQRGDHRLVLGHGSNWCISGNNSSSGIGVSGTSKTGIGVQATSVSGVAVNAQTKSGTYAIEGVASTKGYGVIGGGGVGIYGASLLKGSNQGIGVYGMSLYGTGIGVAGTSGSGPGVIGNSSSGYAGHFTSDSNYGVFAESTSSVAFVGRTENGNASDIQGSHVGVLGRAPSSGYPLVATDANANTVFQVDGVGNVSYAGSLSNFASTIGGGKARSFSASGTRPTIEDSGTAQLVNGAAIVRLDPTFAGSIDSTTAYRVFLTPAGDTRGLYVANRSLAGFAVRESQAGHSTVAFDYRILATALGKTGQRMAPISPATDPSVVKAPLPALPAAAASAPLKAPAFPSVTP